MIEKLIVLASLSFLMTSCMTMVTLTGEKKPALPDDAEVKVYNLKYPEKYDEVGYMVIRGNNIENRIEQAKKIAREYGCNGILPREEEKKQRTWEEAEYETVYEDDPVTGLPKTEHKLKGYKTRHEEWIEQVFFLIFVN